MFIGSGLSRRYLGLEDWEGLLRKLAFLTKENDFAYEMYNRKAENEGHKIGHLQKIAELIDTDLSTVWFEGKQFEESRAKYRAEAKKGVSPLKIEISNYIKKIQGKI